MTTADGVRAAMEETTDAAASAPRRRRRPWSLQARLMVTITGIVALILVGVSLATSAIIGTILQENLDTEVRTTVQQTGQSLIRLQAPPGFAEVTAYDVLTIGRQRPGVVLVVGGSQATGAYVDEDGAVQNLSAGQIGQITDAVTTPAVATVQIDDLGTYRLQPYQAGRYIAIAGLPLSEVQSTIAQMITTVVLVTAGGLLILGAAIALVIRAGLKPLRAVADTATRVAALPMAEGAVSISERVPADEADERTEIGRVGHALNTLLDHVDASLDERQRNEERMRRFVADASHELRTPLASIRGYSELSLRALRQAQGPGGRAQGPGGRAQGPGGRAQGPGGQAQGPGGQAQGPGAPDDSEQALERIQAQSVRMTTLVEDLLLLARLDEGQELVYGTVDLTRLAVEALGDARAAHPDHEWLLEAGEEPVVLAGDAARLHQVATNLLANAGAHTPPGTSVTVSVAREGGDAVLRVHDDGPGIDPAVQGELFERFSRGDRSRARKTGGTGLGLSIARAIVAAHGGAISVRSTPGDTSFEVRLPARPADPAPGR